MSGNRSASLGSGASEGNRPFLSLLLSGVLASFDSPPEPLHDFGVEAAAVVDRDGLQLPVQLGRQSKRHRVPSQ